MSTVAVSCPSRTGTPRRFVLLKRDTVYRAFFLFAVIFCAAFWTLLPCSAQSSPPQNTTPPETQDDPPPSLVKHPKPPPPPAPAQSNSTPAPQSGSTAAPPRKHLRRKRTQVKMLHLLLRSRRHKMPRPRNLLHRPRVPRPRRQRLRVTRQLAQRHHRMHHNPPRHPQRRRLQPCQSPLLQVPSCQPPLRLPPHRRSTRALRPCHWNRAPTWCRSAWSFTISSRPRSGKSAQGRFSDQARWSNAVHNPLLGGSAGSASNQVARGEAIPMPTDAASSAPASLRPTLAESPRPPAQSPCHAVRGVAVRRHAPADRRSATNQNRRPAFHRNIRKTQRAPCRLHYFRPTPGGFHRRSRCDPRRHQRADVRAYGRVRSRNAAGLYPGSPITRRIRFRTRTINRPLPWRKRTRWRALQPRKRRLRRRKCSSRPPSPLRCKRDLSIRSTQCGGCRKWCGAYPRCPANAAWSWFRPGSSHPLSSTTL